MKGKVMKKKQVVIKMMSAIGVLVLAGSFFTGCRSARGYVKKHPELAAEKKKAIKAGELVIGMTKDMADASLGKPDATHAYEYKGKTIETWTYNKCLCLFGKSAYVKFENGLVTGWDVR